RGQPARRRPRRGLRPGHGDRFRGADAGPCARRDPAHAAVRPRGMSAQRKSRAPSGPRTPRGGAWSLAGLAGAVLAGSLAAAPGTSAEPLPVPLPSLPIALPSLPVALPSLPVVLPTLPLPTLPLPTVVLPTLPVP